METINMGNTTQFVALKAVVNHLVAPPEHEWLRFQQLFHSRLLKEGDYFIFPSKEFEFSETRGERLSYSIKNNDNIFQVLYTIDDEKKDLAFDKRRVKLLGDHNQANIGEFLDADSDTGF